MLLIFCQHPSYQPGTVFTKCVGAKKWIERIVPSLQSKLCQPVGGIAGPGCCLALPAFKDAVELFQRVACECKRGNRSIHEFNWAPWGLWTHVQEAQNRVESVPHRCPDQNQRWFDDVMMLFLVMKCWFMMGTSVCCEEHTWCPYEPQGLYYQSTTTTTTNLQPSPHAGYYLSRWVVPPFRLLGVSHQQPSPHPQSHGPSVPSKYPNKFKCNATKWDHLHVPFLFNRIYHLTLWPSLTNGTQGDGGDGGRFLMAVTWKRKRGRKRGRDTLLPEMASTQRGGVNSPPDVLRWNQSNYSPGPACVISSTDVKIIASAQLKFNATAPTSQARMQKT